MKNTNRKGRVCVAAGALLILAALCLTGYNLWDDRRAAEAVSGSYEQLAALIPAGDAVWQGTDSTGEICYPDYVLNPDMEMPTREIDGHDYIGTLDIPALELSLPVISRWSYPNLKLAPCRYTGSAYQDDLVIAAHNYTRHFGNLKHLSVGDEVRFTDVDGNVFSYTVSGLEQLAPTAVGELQAGGWALTLFTCTLGGQYRVAVRCVPAEPSAADRQTASDTGHGQRS
ncbi:MAG: sortase [Oscillospiraceae bacterium]|nr:sortase [Oscillospiraceae bacterium]